MSLNRREFLQYTGAGTAALAATADLKAQGSLPTSLAGAMGAGALAACTRYRPCVVGHSRRRPQPPERTDRGVPAARGSEPRSRAIHARAMWRQFHPTASDLGRPVRGHRCRVDRAHVRRNRSAPARWPLASTLRQTMRFSPPRKSIRRVSLPGCSRSGAAASSWCRFSCRVQ